LILTLAGAIRRACGDFRIYEGARRTENQRHFKTSFLGKLVHVLFLVCMYVPS
jgi:hypothetical protein